MSEAYSLDPLNDFATLYGLFVKLGGEVTKVHKVSAPWVSIQIGDKAALRAREGGSVVEITQDFFRDFAALAGELEKVLIEHAEDHRSYPFDTIDIGTNGGTSSI